MAADVDLTLIHLASGSFKIGPVRARWLASLRCLFYPPRGGVSVLPDVSLKLVPGLWDPRGDRGRFPEAGPGSLDSGLSGSRT